MAPRNNEANDAAAQRERERQRRERERQRQQSTMPRSGASPEAVKAFAESNPNSRTAAAIANPAPPKPANVAQAIRQAGESGITKKEFQSITQDFGKSSAAVLQKIDEVNKNLREKDKTGINLGGAASNMLIREASKESPTGYQAYLNILSGKPTLGTGRLGTELQRRATEFGTTGGMGSLIPRGMQVMPSGRATLPGIGEQFGPPKVTVKGDNIGDPLGSNRGTTTTGLTEESPEVIPEEIPEEMKEAGISNPFFTPNATVWRRNKKGKGRGIKSTRAASGGQRNMPKTSPLGY